MSTETRQAIALILSPALVGCVVAGIADRMLVTRTLLWLEPSVWIALCGLVLHLAMTRRWVQAIALAIGWMLLAAALRFPVGRSQPSSELVVAAGACSASLDDVASTTTLVSADWSPSPTFGARLAQLDADVLVLSGVPRDAAPPLAAALGAVVSGHAGTAVFVRGDFRSCEGQGASHIPGGSAAIVALKNGNIFPLLTLAGATSTDMDPLTAAGLGLESRNTVAIGHMRTHGTFRHAESLWRGAGFESAPQQPTWPAKLGALPLLPLYHADRLWFGDAWQVADVTTERIPESRRLALRVVLEPV
ncbi:MAG: hypothetical protein KC912_04495 [Proteobacteria bacterium]|nr:hypothetical protein [Pseudomonadota bacterium]